MKSELVDRIGDLAAKIAPLAEKLEELKAELAAKGRGHYEGTRYDATVSVFDRVTLDMKAVRSKLSSQFIRAHSTKSVVVQVRTTARKAWG